MAQYFAVLYTKRNAVKQRRQQFAIRILLTEKCAHSKSFTCIISGWLKTQERNQIQL